MGWYQSYHYRYFLAYRGLTDIYASLLFIDERRQTIPAWPSFLTSNGAGVIGLLHYLFFRRSDQEFSQKKDIWLKIWDSRLYGIVLSAIAFSLLAYAFKAGDWNDYVQQWLTNPFVHLISLYFILNFSSINS